MADKDDKAASIGFIQSFLKQPVNSVPADNSNMFQRASERAAAEGIELIDAFRQERQTKSSTTFGTDQGFFSIFQNHQK